MATTTPQSHSKGPAEQSSARNAERRRVLLIEENPLTAWVIEQKLYPIFDVIRCSTLTEVKSELQRTNIQILICGSPLVDDDPEAVHQLASNASLQVIALVSSPDSSFASPITVLEKPFELNRLTKLLSDNSSEHSDVSKVESSGSLLQRPVLKIRSFPSSSEP